MLYLFFGSSRFIFKHGFDVDMKEPNFTNKWGIGVLIYTDNEL